MSTENSLLPEYPQRPALPSPPDLSPQIAFLLQSAAAARAAAADAPPPVVPVAEVPEVVMTPELQAQLAALTQQAMASLNALLASLRAAEAQLALQPPPSTPPETPPGGTDDMPVVAPPDPVPPSLSQLAVMPLDETAWPTLKQNDAALGGVQPSDDALAKTGGVALGWAPMFQTNVAAPTVTTPVDAAPAAPQPALAELLADLVPAPVAAIAPQPPAAIEASLGVGTADDPYVLLAGWTQERIGAEGSAL